VVNSNTAGVLSKVLAVFGAQNVNIIQQMNKSRGDIAYNLIDLEKADGVDWKKLQKEVTSLPEVKSSRIIYGATPLGGYGYAKNVPGTGYVV
jgi:D-3-phosphoglycerate dehydrogenase / 2-oxoglutarate reductase